MVGQGVYLKGRSMICELGDPHLFVAVWIFAGLLSLAGALSYAELGAMMPQTGGAYVYLGRAYGAPVARAFGWVSFLAIAPASLAALAAGTAIFFGGITGVPVGETVAALGPFHLTGITLVALAFLGGFAALNCASTRLNGAVVSVTTIVKIATLVAIAGAAYAFAHPASNAAATATSACGRAAHGLLTGIAPAVLGALYAYIGWASLPMVASEVLRPRRTLPIALGTSVAIVIVLYVAVNAGLERVLGIDAIRALPTSVAIGLAGGRALLGAGADRAFAAVLFISAAATLHISILANARVTLALGEDDDVRALAPIARNGSPVAAILWTCALAALLLTVADFDRISDGFTFVTWLFVTITTIGLFVLRRREPDAPRPYRTWGYPIVPAAFVLVGAWLIVESARESPLDSAVTLAIVALAAAISFMRGRTRVAT